MIYAIGYYLGKGIARGVFDLRVEGLAYVPEHGPAILAPNHVSYLDPVLVGVSVRRRVQFMAKRELFRNPAMGWFLRQLQAYPVTRERLDPSTLKRTLSLLDAGHLVLMFPEGTRGDGRTLGPAKPGIAVVAARSGAPVIPVYHAGAEQILPRGGRRLRRAPVRVRFGPPLTLTKAIRADRAALERFCRELMDAIGALRPQADRLIAMSG